MSSGGCFRGRPAAPPPQILACRQTSILVEGGRRVSSLRLVGYHQPTGYYAGGKDPLAHVFVRFPALRTLIVNDAGRVHSRVAPSLDTPLWKALGSLWHLDLRVLHARVPATALASLRAIRRLSLALDVPEHRHARRGAPAAEALKATADPPFVVTDAVLAALTTLEDLRIDGRVRGGLDVFAGFSGSGLAPLVRLRSLALVHCTLQPGVLRALPASVRSLDFSGSTGLTAASFAALPHPASIRVLRYDQSPGAGIDAGALGAALPGLEELRLGEDSVLVCDALLYSLAAHGVLRALWASAAASPAAPRSLTVAGWSTLLSACPVERLELSGLRLISSAAAVLDAPPAASLPLLTDALPSAADAPRDGIKDSLPAAADGMHVDSELPLSDAVDAPALIDASAASAYARPASGPADVVAEGAPSAVANNSGLGDPSGSEQQVAAPAVDDLPLLSPAAKACLTVLSLHVDTCESPEVRSSSTPRPRGPALLRSLNSPGFARIRSLSLRGLSLPQSPDFFAPVAPTLISLDVHNCDGLCETSFAPLAELVSLDAGCCGPYLPRLVQVGAGDRPLIVPCLHTVVLTDIFASAVFSCGTPVTESGCAPRHSHVLALCG